MGQTRLFILVTAISLGEGKLWIGAKCTPLWNWLIVTSCSWRRGWVTTHGVQQSFFVLVVFFFFFTWVFSLVLRCKLDLQNGCPSLMDSLFLVAEGHTLIKLKTNIVYTVLYSLFIVSSSFLFIFLLIWEFFSPVLVDGFLQEFEWQQVFTSLLEYS